MGKDPSLIEDGRSSPKGEDQFGLLLVEVHRVPTGRGKPLKPVGDGGEDGRDTP